MTVASQQIRRRLICRGTVQGVGFRPAVFRLAASLQLGGWVLNSPQGVIIEIQGSPAMVEQFIERLPCSLPKLADLRDMELTELSPQEACPFVVLPSEGGQEAQGSLPPDSALCEECLRDMNDPANRRYRYPFTTCSNCGPRFSVVHHLPYDRERTSMCCFPLCPNCEREYTDPSDRRFHAEPLACPACGPRLWLVNAGGELLAENAKALELARETLARGDILALKGVGGFQLACRADRSNAVERLRLRKRRSVKPFAVMVRDLKEAGRCAYLTSTNIDLLQSAAAPILLAPARSDGPIADETAPGLADIGLMIPTTPLHVELFIDTEYDVLIMTSGNSADEPICCHNREALQRLSGIADLFLLHDRDIVRRLDDSVYRTQGNNAYSVRRSRGSIPAPLPLPEPVRVPSWPWVDTSRRQPVFPLVATRSPPPACRRPRQ